MKNILVSVLICLSIFAFISCEGGPYDSGGNGAVIRETNTDDLDQMEGFGGTKSTVPGSDTDHHPKGDTDRGTQSADSVRSSQGHKQHY